VAFKQKLDVGLIKDVIKDRVKFSCTLRERNKARKIKTKHSSQKRKCFISKKSL